MMRGVAANDPERFPMSEKTTLISGTWIVAYENGEHRILENGVIAIRGDRIVHVGKDWPAEADHHIDGSGKLICPGFISLHCHAYSHLGDRLVIDGGRRSLLRTGFLNYAAPRSPDGRGFGALDDAASSYRFGLGAMMKSGVTTALHFDGGPSPEGGNLMRKAVKETGIRLYYGTFIGGAQYRTNIDGQMTVSRDEDVELASLENAVRFIERHSGESDGRLTGILIVDELYNSSEKALLRATAAARSLGVKKTIHASEQLFEFHEILRRTGDTPVAWMNRLGFLDPDTILAHCIYVSGHPYSGYPFGGDLEILAQSGATVAHAPVALSRRAVAMNSFQKYLDHGVKIGLGTDSYPLDMLGEMRAASIIGKITDANNESARSRDIFNAATLGGADALGRSDLGRIARGAKADIVMIDLDSFDIGPVYDPIQSLIHCATTKHVDTVLIDGKPVVSNGKLTMIDEATVLASCRKAADLVCSAFPDYHWKRSTVSEVFPRSFPAASG
jgi:cytosine/adenosine deaminase-related metal-dependent hydrolase